MPIVEVVIRLALGAGREVLEPGVVGDALVGVAVGEQDEGGAVAVGGALGLLDSAQQPAGEVGHPAGIDAGQRLAGVGAVADGARRRPAPRPVVEGDEAEAVLGAKPADQARRAPAARRRGDRRPSSRCGR